MRKHSLSIILFLLCLILSDVFSQTRVDWRQLKNTPTTIEGYGITDSVSIDSLNEAVDSLREDIPTNASFTFQGLSDTWNAIETKHMADEAVTTAKIDDGAVNTDKLANNAVTSDKIADSNVTSDKLDYGSVVEDKIAPNAVTTDKIDDRAVTTGKLATGSVNESILSDFAVTTDKLGAKAVTTEKLADGSITSDKMGYASVYSGAIGQDAITGYHISDNSVAGDKLVDDAVTAEKLADEAVTAPKILDGSVVNSKIADGAVTEDKLGINSVTSNKILLNSILNHHIYDGQVSTDKIANGAITSDKILFDAVTTEKIPNGAITPVKLDALATWIFEKLFVTTLSTSAVKFVEVEELPTAFLSGMVFYDGSFHIWNSYNGSSGFKRIATEYDLLAIPNNASFTLTGLGEKNFASLTNKPTTLSGYGITDSIAPVDHASELDTYGAGSTTKYGHVKTIDNLNQQDHAAGLALSAHQGYVLKNSVANKLDSAGGTITGALTVQGGITGTISTATVAITANSANSAVTATSATYASSAGSSVYSGKSQTVVAQSTQAGDTLPVAFESSLYPTSASSYSGIYSPEDATLVIRTGTDSYRLEADKLTLGKDMRLITRNIDTINPAPLHISGGNAFNKGGNIWLGGNADPMLSLALDNKPLISLLHNNVVPVIIASHTAIHGNLEASKWVIGAEGVSGNHITAEKLQLFPIERSELPGSLPSSGLIYYDATDQRYYGRINNQWKFLGGQNSDFTLAGLSEKDFASLTNKPTTLSGYGITDAASSSHTHSFASLTSKPTTLSGYGITDAAASSHTHNYAGSASAGGAATSADKLNTNAGSVTQPVYFSNGVPVATTYTLGKSVPSNAVFTDTNTTYSANNGISLSGTTFSNSGVRSVAAGSANGTISVNTNGTAADVAVKGLGSAAYTASTAYAASSHTHNYAGSSSAGGAATSADKLNTNAGSVTQPVYFSNGVPVATTYTLGKSVPSNAVFTDTNTTYSANNGISLSGTTFSNSGVRSVAAGSANGTISVNTNGTAADVAVKGLGSAAYTASTAYAASSHTHNYAGSSSAGGAATSANKVNNTLTITFNGGVAEGVNKFTFDGSAAKVVNIESIGDDEGSFYWAENGLPYYYVSPTGNDTTNDGLSAASPFKTINKAIQEGAKQGVNLHPGSSIQIVIVAAAGTYPESVQIQNSNLSVMILGSGGDVTIQQIYCRGGKVSISPPYDYTLKTTHGFTATDGGFIIVMGGSFECTPTAMFGNCLTASNGGTVVVENSPGLTLRNTLNWFQPFKAEFGGSLSISPPVIIPTGSKVDTLYQANGGLLFFNSTSNSGTVTTIYNTEKGGRIYSGSQTKLPDY